MDQNNFKGVGVALVTPFRTDGSIDFSALETLINFQINNGTDYLVALGTTSESATMTVDEKNAVVDFVIDINQNRKPLVVGCGGNNTASLVSDLKKYQKPGIDALLSVAPYYNKPNQRGLFEHFKAVANGTNLPVLLYNVPGRTASNLSAETTVALAKKFKNIMGTKEASGNFSQCMQLVKNKPKNFLLISGDDALTLPLVALGFDGVISVVQNAFPAEYSKLVQAAMANDFAAARTLQYKLVDIIDALFEEGNPSGVKAFMAHKGMLENNLRLPLVPVSEPLFQRIGKMLSGLK
jgi:4-hydroxy-tetrahydrodipicolinate synthase